MASVWLTTATHKAHPQKLVGHLKPAEARVILRDKVLKFIKTPCIDATKPPAVKMVGSDTVLLYHGDGLVGSLHIEHVSPPTQAGKGDNWIPKTEAH
jgi:hypothetical protein